MTIRTQTDTKTPARRPLPRQFDGLTSAQVAERVARGETNDYKARVSRTYVDIVRDNIFNLFNIVLGTLLVIVLLNRDYGTVFFAGFSVVSNAFLGMIQEISAKRKLDQLATHAEQVVTVWRDGHQHSISMREVVIDDVVEIEPGSRLVVDGEVISSDALEVDESLLTGESDAIYKQPGDPLLSGSFCIAGTGVMKATRVGKNSNINKLSAIAKQYRRQLTPTQHRINAIVEITVVIMFALVPMLFVSAYLDQLIFNDAIRNAVVFVTSLVPQGLVLVAILALTIGAIRISQHDTLIQRVNAVESLANATTLCFDKTGTLTLNQLAVTEIIPLSDQGRDEVLCDLRRYLENLAHLNHTAKAVQHFIDDQGVEVDFVGKQREIPFTSGRKWGAVVLPDQTLVMGAPERVLPANGRAASAQTQAEQLSHDGMRVLAFARMATPPANDTLALDSVEPIALIVLSDQVRDDIQATLQSFREENIDLKVISGDNLATVRAIARQAGMVIQAAYTGQQVDAMSDIELEAAVQTANLFARVDPNTKRRIIAALQSQGAYVAMVGDGVNDVPALKQANLAIVMNDGTQISKDVADIVLLNNAMSTLPLAFSEGREITQTVYATMKLFLVKNFYNIVLFVFAAFMSLPFPITPIQLSWVTFGTVNIQATLIAIGWVRPKYMEQFRRDVLEYLLIAGVINAGMVTILYVIAYLGSGGDVALSRSAVTIFCALLGTMIVWHVQGVDFYEPHTFIEHWRIVSLTSVLAILTILSMYAVPDILEFKPLTSDHMLIIIAIVALFELAMMLIGHSMRHRYLVRRLWMLVQP